jgi:leucyl aminopeptidase
MAVIAEKGLKRIRARRALSRFNPIPSINRFAGVTVDIARSVPADADCIGVPVATTGELPRRLGVDRATLRKSGFESEVGQTVVLPQQTGPTIVAVGIGDPEELDAARLRDAAAAFARAASKHTHFATALADVPRVPPDVAAQAVVEGILLASYSYDVLKREGPRSALTKLTLVGTPEGAFSRGASRGRIFAGAAMIARDLANAPATHLTATRMVEAAKVIASDRGLGIKVFDIDALEKLGCGGLLGVNRGSVEPPYMIKLTYQPKRLRKPAGHVALVGKGIMFDSGGISLKPNDLVHATMKLDMSGAAAILSAMSVLHAIECPTAVTGYLMCTDNMPSGSAMVLGDVLTIRGGKTVEVLNTDAEGRLIMADAMVLATEETPDAIVSIATLTGAALRALGPSVAAVLGNNQSLVEQAIESARRTDEPVWQFPLVKRYRKQLDSQVADLNNVGGEHAGTITAGLFLAEFVGNIPWAHIDIAGTVRAETDDSWRSRGATGFGARLLADLVENFTQPRVVAGGRGSKAA